MHRITVSDQPDSAHKTALVVDDDPQVHSVISDILGPNGWTIEIASDNQAILELVGVRPFGLIVTGEKTSGREDVELLQKIRRARPHTRVIILTDSSAPADVIAAMREHAFSYFSKPFSYDCLAEMVRHAAEGPCWDDGIEVVSATPAWISLIARCEVKTADRLVRFIMEIADLPAPEKSDVATAFREMLLNAIEHGGHFDPSQYVEIMYVRTHRAVLCRIKDPGEGFSHDEIMHAAFANPPDDPVRHMHFRQAQNLRPGGFGVLIARNLVDELVYGEKGNEVLLVKYLDRNAGQLL